MTNFWQQIEFSADNLKKMWVFPHRHSLQHSVNTHTAIYILIYDLHHSRQVQPDIITTTN